MPEERPELRKLAANRPRWRALQHVRVFVSVRACARTWCVCVWPCARPPRTWAPLAPALTVLACPRGVGVQDGGGVGRADTRVRLDSVATIA